MNKIITTMLFGFLLSTNAYSQEKNDFDNDFSKSIIKENTKNIDYSLTVLKNDKPLYSSQFTLKNSKIIPVFYLEENSQREKVLDQAKGISQGMTMNEIKANQIIEKEIYQLKLAVHLEKQTQTMWTNLYIQSLDTEKNEEVNTASFNNSSQEVKGVILNKKPQSADFKKELIIMHQDGKETKMAWKDYLFILKGHVK